MKVFLKKNETQNQWRNNYYLLEDPDELGGREIKLEPYTSYITFEVLKLKHTYEFKTEYVYLRLDDVDFSEKPERKTTESLVGDMEITGEKELSFIGTNRIIKKFKIEIRSFDEEINEFSGYSESEYFPEDEMTLHILVTDERFQTIKKITEKNTNHKIRIITSGVTGLYSEWIPPFTDINPNYIKVLTYDNDVEIPEDSDIEPFRLKNIQRCELYITEE